LLVSPAGDNVLNNMQIIKNLLELVYVLQNKYAQASGKLGSITAIE
jgi:hypothetical protein